MKNLIYNQVQKQLCLLNRFSKHFGKKVAALATLSMFICTLAFGQGRPVTGSVTDSTGAVLPNVSLRIKGTTSGTFTGIDGKFKLNVPGNDAVLVVTYVGYHDKEVTVGDVSDLKIVLQQSVSQLTDVVVVGYGTVEKKNLTIAVTTVKN
jgi:hypothetical protein